VTQAGEIMTRPRTPHRFVIAVVSALMLSSASLPARSASDELTRAKQLYASASYDEALQILEALHVAAPESEATEVEAYRVFCLVALGRSAEAKRAIEAIVKAEPLYHPNESVVSPRVRTFFENTRRPMLGDIVRQTYAKAKDAFDKKDMTEALAGFDRVMALLDEIGASDDQGVSDLRTLAGGFRDLAKAAIPPPPAKTPPPAPAPESAASAQTEAVTPPAPAPSAPAKQPVTGPVTFSANDTDVQPPVAISQPLPRWVPENPIEEKRTFRGALDLLVAEDGHVISVTLTKSVHPRYDATLLKAAQDWKFRPAVKDGQPVKYHYAMAVQLGRQ
jgi:TonB family protein